MVKVRVVKCSQKGYWYENHIGDIYTVKVVASGDYMFSDFGEIDKEDAEVVEDVEKGCDNCRYDDLLGDEHPCNNCSPSRDMWKPIEQEEEKIAGVGQDAPTGNSEIGSTYTATHYMICNQQPIEIMQSIMSEEMLRGFLWGNVIKYSLRLNRKGKMREDAGKCLQYAIWLCDVMDGKKILPGGK